MQYYCCIYFVVIAICNLWSWSIAEVFTAVNDCETLLATYKHVIDHLDTIVKKEDKQLSDLKQYLDLSKREYEKASANIPDYVGNPINAFCLIKRLTFDLYELERRTNTSIIGYIKAKAINDNNAKMPYKEDLFGAAAALTRLQNTYMLKAEDLAEGKINGVVYGLPMTVSDCYELGRILYLDEDYKNAIPWIKEALRKYEVDNNANFIKKTEMIEILSNLYYLSGQFKSALEWTKNLLRLNPKHSRAQHYLQMLKKKANEILLQMEEQPVSAWPVKYGQYEALCRGEYGLAPEVTKKLTCFYLTKNHPFLRLAPIKAEQLYIDPDVYIFPNILSDREIEYIKREAKPKFERATVFNPKTEKMENANYRICKSTFLYEDEVICPISQRISDLSGLSMDTAEELQVANYGIGGHYERHFDHLTMSEVAQGGATVFPELGLSVFPVKNAALFWLNLHPSGEGDMSMLHAGCPVLQGSKWVSTKWIRMAGQEFRRPCSLEYQPEELVRQFPPLIPLTNNNVNN